MPVTAYLIGFVLDVYGPEGAWCGVPSVSAHLLLLDLWLMLGMLFLAVIYLWTAALLWLKMRKYLRYIIPPFSDFLALQLMTFALFTQRLNVR